jgi:hypothetical protein
MPYALNELVSFETLTKPEPAVRLQAGRAQTEADVVEL